jgi:alpha-tubulin suppressor-like RCC1 family protein
MMKNYLIFILALLSHCGVLVLEDGEPRQARSNPIFSLLGLPADSKPVAKAPELNPTNPDSSYVVSVHPNDQATWVSVDTLIRVRFINEVDLNTVALGENFTLQSAQGNVQGSYNFSGEELVFTPKSRLNYGTNYKVILKKEIKYLNGTSVGSDFVFEFQTEMAPVSEPFSLVETIPNNFSMFVPENQRVEVRFNKPLDPNSVQSESITALDGMGNPIPGKTHIVGNVSNKIYFSPENHFPAYSTIVIEVSGGLKDTQGNSLGADYSFSFDTGETIGPFVVSSNPIRNAFGVGIQNSIIIQFNKEIFPLVDSFNVYLQEDNGETVPGAYSVMGSEVVFTPFLPLKKKTRYKLMITEAVMDWSFNPASPMEISFTTEIPVQMALGDGFSCYLSREGKVRCWGFNIVGQLGIGEERFNQPDALQAREIPFEEKALEIAAGLSHVCALFTSGRMKCWGGNSFGQLGTGNNLNLRDPVKRPYLVMPDLVKKISANFFNTCVIFKSEKTTCWGDNVNRTLGFGYLDANNDPPSSVNTPMMKKTIDVNDQFYDISVGSNYFCGVLKNDHLRCWGNGTRGQLGIYYFLLFENGIIDFFSILSVPVNLQNAFVTNASNSWTLTMDYPLFEYDFFLPSKILQLATSQSVSCALKANRRILCWGDLNSSIVNKDIYLGPSSETDAVFLNQLHPWPEDPSILKSAEYELSSSVVSFSAKSNHICVVFDTGSVQCWGQNGRYQLGQGEPLYFNSVLGQFESGYRPSLPNNAVDFFDHARVSEMYLGENAIGIETSTNFSCAIFESGNFKCWGDNSFGQLGYGHTETIQNAVSAPIISFP